MNAVKKLSKAKGFLDELVFSAGAIPISTGNCPEALVLPYVQPFTLGRKATDACPKRTPEALL